MSGRLYVLGMGPGDQDWITPVVSDSIASSTDVVGYGYYLDLLKEELEEKICHVTPLGEEIGRVELALSLAAEGKSVSLISSGDIGIYALATLVFEVLERSLKSSDTYEAVDIQVFPGISAMQAGASRAGALLGHDFCTISLSDLLTPWATIEKRLHAAGIGDFVVVFYNPKSKKRDWQLAKAIEILLEYRPAKTPVLVARQLTRGDEEIRLVRLDQLDVTQVDMFTLVMVGNSETRQVQQGDRTWAYTPRGYEGKA